MTMLLMKAVSALPILDTHLMLFRKDIKGDCLASDLKLQLVRGIDVL